MRFPEIKFLSDIYNVNQSYTPNQGEGVRLLQKKFENLRQFQSYFKKEQIYHNPRINDLTNVENEESNANPNIPNSSQQFEILIVSSKVFGEENYLSKRAAREVVREGDNFFTIFMT